MKKNLVLLAFLSLIPGPYAQAESWTLLVSPSGKDTRMQCSKDASETCIDGLTLEQALALTTQRDWDKKGDQVRIELGPGTYRPATPLNIAWGKGQSAAGQLDIVGPKQGTATISGGRIVTGWQPVSSSLNRAPRWPRQSQPHLLLAGLAHIPDIQSIPPVAQGFLQPILPVAMDVFFRGEPLHQARWPNRGYGAIHTSQSFLQGDAARHIGIDGRHVTDWEGETALIARGFFGHDYAEESIPIAALDEEQNELILASRPRPGVRNGRRILIVGALSELDEPGEWYWDRTRQELYLWPPDKIRDGDVEISVLDTLLRINGGHNVRLSRLTFEMVRGDALAVLDSNNVVIEDSVIRDTGNRGAVFIGGSNSGLRRVSISQTGEGGVILTGGNRNTLAPAKLFVEQCDIRYFSRLSSTYRPAVWVRGVGNRVVENVIEHAPHAAIIFNGNDHFIAYNQIGYVVQETHDAGAIYTGRDWTARGTIIAHNLLHDIGPPHPSDFITMGIYLDDQTCGTTIRGNIFARVPHPIFLGGGRDNLVEDNLFFHSEPAIHLDARGLEWQQATTHNTNGPFLKNLAAVPYNRPPYSDRYPHLANILEDEPGSPKYNVARNNLIIVGKAFDIRQQARQGIALEHNRTVGEEVFLHSMPSDARMHPEDFRLNPEAPSLNGILPDLSLNHIAP